MSEPTEMAKRVAQRRAEKCRHFNGIQHDKCKAGICYKELQKDYELVLPCLPNFVNVSKRNVATCDKFATFTAEELAQQEKEIATHLECFSKVMTAITPVRKTVKASGKSWKGRVDCAACGGKNTLFLSFSSYNWHCHGKCSTPGCVAWME
jgi:hypothetical protein